MTIHNALSIVKEPGGYLQFLISEMSECPKFDKMCKLIKNRIYMDYQASTPVDQRVIEAMKPFFFDHPGNPHSSDHAFGWEANAAIDEATQKIASAIVADPDEIIFTSGATEGNNLAIIGAAGYASADRRRILVSSIEHKSVFAAAYAASEQFDLVIEQLPVDHNGIIRLDILEERLATDVLLVSVMTVNNEIGTIQPVKDVTSLCRNVGALIHTDAVQALTAMPLDVNELDVDFLSLSAHKLYGPKGIGALFIRRDVQRLVKPLIYGGGQQNGLRAGTLPVPLCVGFGAAIELVTSADAVMERIKIRALRDQFIEQLNLITTNIHINGASGDLRHPGNANICFRSLDAHELIGALQPFVAASTGAACTSGIPEPSHVLRAIGLSDTDARASIRFSIGRFTSGIDIHESIDALHEVMNKIKPCKTGRGL